jgi:hypothetical protein
LQGTIVRLETPARERLAPGPPPGLDDRTAAAFARGEADRSNEDRDLIFEAQLKDVRVTAESIAAALEPDQALALAEARDALERLKVPPPLSKARVLDEAGPAAPATFLRKRGDFYAPGPEVDPAFPAVLSSAPATIVTTSRSTGRRAALAAWLTRADHPLTARVIVNRLWQHHFGQALVATPNDFGRRGDSPSHPELLDWLDTKLVARGWSLKAMHRLMVTSAAYRQSSRHNEAAATIDPGNTLLWRHSRRHSKGKRSATQCWPSRGV